MGNKKASKSKIMSQFFKAPMRVLVKARDFYMVGMNGCAGYFDNGAVPGYPVFPLPRSFSVNSYSSAQSEPVTDSDTRLFQKSFSTNNLTHKVDMETLPRQGSRKVEIRRTVPRSQSTGIERIDEDKLCEFSDDLMVKKSVFDRSRSCGVSRNDYRRL